VIWLFRIPLFDFNFFWRIFSEVSSVVILQSTLSSKLTFKNFLFEFNLLFWRIFSKVSLSHYSKLEMTIAKIKNEHSADLQCSSKEPCISLTLGKYAIRSSLLDWPQKMTITRQYCWLLTIWLPCKYPWLLKMTFDRANSWKWDIATFENVCMMTVLMHFLRRHFYFSFSMRYVEKLGRF